jgi:hypothetical protein
MAGSERIEESGSKEWMRVSGRHHGVAGGGTSAHFIRSINTAWNLI